MKCYQYYPNFINKNYLNILFDEINLQQDYIDFDGTIVKESRLTSWQTETISEYGYAGKKLVPSPLTDTVKMLKNIIELKNNVKLDSVLINYYKDGNDHIIIIQMNIKYIKITIFLF
jgi:alkylated DNA repair dioxygenase AlkB